MGKKSMEKKGEKDHFTALSTEYSHRHTRTKEEYPEGPYGGPPHLTLGKSSGWDTGEEVSPQFSFENEQLHEATQRRYPQRDPIRENPEGHLD